MANALIRESSPYLLQHAHNPVDWRPWGVEAFDLARRLDRAIFLSVGYSTCYWCHVMERQCFENPQIAAAMNEHFVNIKVDREERPDVDEVYMTAVQLMTGRGGWPMSVFLTPPGADTSPDSGTPKVAAAPPGRRTASSSSLMPFYAGTYFPPESSQGMPGFPEVLRGVAEAWKNQRAQVLEQARRIADAVREHMTHAAESRTPDAGLVQAAANQLARSYDPADGGFGPAEGSKFPQPCNLLFLIKVYRNNPNAELWHAIAHTLDRMARGGIYDQAGGGFHRYATDGRWLVPHFEKMLYDNAQLVEAYLAAQAARPHDGDSTLYPRIVRQTCEYVLREMTDAETGAFYSAQDAEVEGREGANYLWQPADVKAAIGDAKLAELALDLYGLNEGSNFQDPHHADAPAANVLHLPEPLDAVARRRQVALEQITAEKTEIDRLLLAARARRKQPATDDKTLAGWNGMMIAALARAGAELSEPRYVRAAARAAGAILERLRDTNGGLMRTMRRGAVKTPALPGFLDDYAFFIHGLIELHRAEGGPRWLAAAEELTQAVEDRFGQAKSGGGDDGGRAKLLLSRSGAQSGGTSGGGGEEPSPLPESGGTSEGRGSTSGGGGYFDAPAAQSELFVRTQSLHDGALPSPNSQMIHNLLDLYEQTGERTWLERAARDLRSFGAEMARYGAGMTHMHHALLRLLEIDPRCFDGQAEAAEASRVPESAGVANASGPVSVTCDPPELDLSNGVGEARVKLVIAPGYHLNAGGDTGRSKSGNDSGTGRVVATVLNLGNNTDEWELKVVYPPATERRFAFAEGPLAVYEGTIELTATLRRRKAARNAKSGDPRLLLRYQACTDRRCLAPSAYVLPLTIR